MIRALAPLLLATALTAPLAAQDDQAALVAKYEAKLEAEYITFGGWITDYDEARARAKKEGKLIFAYFSRSYSP